MSTPGSAIQNTISALVGNRITELELGPDAAKYAFFPPLSVVDEMLNNKIDVGGGDQVQVPYVKNKYTVTVAETYQQSTAATSETDLIDYLLFSYQYLYFDILVYKQEAMLSKNKDGGKSFMSTLDMRLANAAESQRLKIANGLFQGDGASASTFCGFQNFWYAATYGGATRNTAAIAHRFDAASATTKLQGGNGTKYTDAIPLDGKKILDFLIPVYWGCSNGTDSIKQIYCDPIVFGAIRAQLSNKATVNLNEINGKATTGKPSEKGLEFENGYIIPLPVYDGTNLQSGLITRGHVFGINPNHCSIPCVEGMEMKNVKPLAEVQSQTYIGGTSVQFMASGRVITNKPTAHFWCTQVGLA